MSPLDVGGKKKETPAPAKKKAIKEKTPSTRRPYAKKKKEIEQLQLQLASANGQIQVLQDQLTKARRFPQWKDVMDVILSYKGKNRDMLLLKNQAGPKNSNQKFMWRIYSLIRDMYVGAQE